MAKKTGGKARTRARVLKGNVEFTGALLLAALLQAQGASAEGLDARTILAKLSDKTQLTPEEMQLLHLAVAIEAPELLTAAELESVIDAESLVTLGLDAEFVAKLLQNDTAEVLRQLKQAFAPKLKAALASAEHKIFAGDPQFKLAAAQAESAGGTEAAAGSGGFLGGISPLALLAGVAGIGVLGVAMTDDGDSAAPAPANTAPVATNDSASTNQNGAVTINVLGNDTDANGDKLTVTHINGTAISVNAPVTIQGVGTISINDAGVLTFTPLASYSGNTAFEYTISDGKGGTAKATVSLSVVKVQTGVVSDGYIANGDVFIDVNGNGQLDTGEPTAKTDANGKFTIASNLTGPIVAVGGTNTDTGLPNNVTLKAPVGSTVVNPLTTIVQALVASGSTLAEAKADVAAALGLPATVDLTTYDILAQPATDATAVAAQKAAAQIVTLLNAARDAGGGAAAGVEAAVVAEIAEFVATGAALDLTSSSVLAEILDDVPNLSDAAVVTVAAKAAAVNQAIETADNLGEISDIVEETDGETPTSLTVSSADLDFAVANAATLVSGGIVEFDVGGEGIVGDLTIGEVQAASLITAGIHFAAEDHITLSAGAGTKLATTLTDLQTLGVDAVTMEVGPGGLAALDPADLPRLASDSLDVTLRVDATADNETDLAQLAVGLAAAGVDHIDIVGELPVEMSIQEALGLNSLGLDFAEDDDVTVSLSNVEFSALATPENIAKLGEVGVDRLDINGEAFGSVGIFEDRADALVDAGISFAEQDFITLVSAGTHLSTSLKDLQTLGVDGFKDLSPTSPHLTVDLGGKMDILDGITNFAVPALQGDAALDVTLAIDTADLEQDADLGTLLGVDLTAGLEDGDLYGQLIQTLEAAGIDGVRIEGEGRVEIGHELADKLLDLGFEAADAEIVVIGDPESRFFFDASLQELAHIGADKVELSDFGDEPVYIEFGLEEDSTVEEFLAVLDALDSDNDPDTPLISGTAEVALEIDPERAETLAQIDGIADKLHDLGFTQIAITELEGGEPTQDVLDTLSGNGLIEVKVLGTGVGDEPFINEE